MGDSGCSGEGEVRRGAVWGLGGEDGAFSSGYAEIKVGHPGGCWNHVTGAHCPATELSMVKDTGCSQGAEGAQG